MQTKKIYFSIIIPYFNTPRVLTKCLDSLNNQKINKSLYEIIIVDDCSKTNLNKVINKYSKIFTFFKLIILNNNKGPGVARNLGVDNSSGKYIFFVDCDDELKTNTLERLFQIIKIKNYDILSFNYELLDNKRRKFMRNDTTILNVNKKKFIKLFLEMNYNNSVIFSIFKRSFVINNNLKFKKGYHEDILFFFMSFFYSKSRFFLNENLYLKNNQKNSIINTFSIRHINDYMNSWLDVMSFLNMQYNLQYLRKNYQSSFARGLVGIIAILLIKNAKFNLKNSEKNIYFKFILKNSINKYFKYILKSNISFTSRYDKIFEKLLLFSKNNKKGNFSSFEKKIINLI